MYAQADWTTTGAYVYSPAFLQLIAPLKVLPWIAFVGVWTAILLVAVRFLTGPRLFAIGVLLAAAELAGGNISLLLAGRDRRRLPLARRLGARPADQGHAGDRAALVRRPTRVAEPRDRPRRDGGRHRGLGGDHARRVARVAATS